MIMSIYCIHILEQVINRHLAVCDCLQYARIVRFDNNGDQLLDWRFIENMYCFTDLGERVFLCL